jgi:hypothetical protein
VCNQVISYKAGAGSASVLLHLSMGGWPEDAARWWQHRLLRPELEKSGHGPSALKRPRGLARLDGPMKENKSKIKFGYGLGCDGYWAEFKLARWGKIEKALQFFFSWFDWNSKLKFKLNTFLNPDKFKYFTKIETWEFWIKIILKLNSKFKSRIF